MPRRPLLVLLVLFLPLGGCAAMVRSIQKHTQVYFDGPLADDLTRPLPKIESPVARTTTLELVVANTAAGDGAAISSDLIGHGLYQFNGEVGGPLRAALDIGAPYSEDGTSKAFDVIADNRDRARYGVGKRARKAPTGWTEAPRYVGGYSGRAASRVVASGHGDYDDRVAAKSIANSEQKAAEASARGDHLEAQTHLQSAANQQEIANATESAQAAADVMGATAGALAGVVASEADAEFTGMHRFIVEESGLVGPSAPEGTHLHVVVLQQMNSVSFKADSLTRFAVLMILSDAEGNTTRVVEGGDMQVCYNACDVFPKKADAKPIAPEAYHPEVKAALHDLKGINEDGFVFPQLYIVFRHAMGKLQARVAGRGM